MKKKILLIFVSLLLSANFMWSQSNQDELEVVLTAICERTGQEVVTSFLKADNNDLVGYIYMHVILTKDTADNFYYYRVSNLVVTDGTLIFKESKQMSRREVEDFIQQEDPEILDDTLGLGYRYYDGVVRTPRGNFYEFKECQDFYGLKPDHGWSLFLGGYDYYKLDSLKKKFELSTLF